MRASLTGSPSPAANGFCHAFKGSRASWRLHRELGVQRQPKQRGPGEGVPDSKGALMLLLILLVTELKGVKAVSSSQRTLATHSDYEKDKKCLSKCPIVFAMFAEHACQRPHDQPGRVKDQHRSRNGLRKGPGGC